MPVKLDTRGLYTAGNVTLNPQSYMNYYLRSMAAKQARQDAVLKSVNDLSSKLTPSGMDQGDIDNLMQKKNDWMNYISQNEEAYKNPSLDNGKAYGQAMNLYNQALGVIDASKSKVESNKQIAQILANPNNRDMITSDFMDRYHKSTLPLNGGYVPFQFSENDFQDKPYTDKQLTAFNTGARNVVANSIKYNKTYGTPIIDKVNNTQISPYEVKLSDADLNNIKVYAAGQVASSPAFNKYLDKIREKPEMVTALQQVYKDHYGQDQSFDDGDDTKLATALALSNISSDLKGTDAPKPYQLGIFGAEHDRMLNDWVTKWNYELAHPKPTQAASLSNLTDDLILKLGSEGNQVQYKYANGTMENRTSLTPDKKLQNEFGVKDGSKLITPDEIQIKPDGSAAIVFYKKDDTGLVQHDGTKISVDPSRSYDVPKDAFKMRVAGAYLGKRAAAQALQGGTQPSTGNRKFKGVPQGGF